MNEFERLKGIVYKLRSENGCPWDREQTHQSLLPYLLEEANEVFDTIHKNDMTHLKEELGDLILQVFLHAQIESEQNNYTIEDVLKDISDKLIRRHPHVFGTAEADNPEEVLILWDKMKAKEKKDNNELSKSLLDKVPKHFYPLLKSFKYQKEAAKVGFDWDNYEGPLSKIKEEYEEIVTAIKGKDIEEIEHEIGDIIFAVVNLGKFFNIRADVALTTANNRFKKRFNYIEKKVSESGRKFDDFNLEELDKFWDEAKIAENKK